ncbi:Ribosomal protein L39e [Cynara cardunculus var. scolymus]|uniref:Ribosomal protein L39e n=1 Tax=Cynara cardunculus var. scolymus TaxID=59895 RepID=A0A124RY31_CYNCS|nr:Ribosomal protein L39e [Cynara cardunculus var. scolymus]
MGRKPEAFAVSRVYSFRGGRDTYRPESIMPSHKSFMIKKKLAKKMRQNRPIPHWIRMRTDNTIRSDLLCSHGPPDLCFKNLGCGEGSVVESWIRVLGFGGGFLVAISPTLLTPKQLASRTPASSDSQSMMATGRYSSNT